MSVYKTGHGPTSIDMNNASLYAFYRAQKDICDSDPENYYWIDEPCPFACPDMTASGGEACVCGSCAFTKEGCYNYSTFPYFDCKRKDVDCKIGDKTTCTMCDYSPTLTSSTVVTDTHGADGPYLLEDEKYLIDSNSYCFPGDPLFVTAENREQAILDGMLCVNYQQPNYYEVNGERVVCTPDEDGDTKSVMCQIAGSKCTSDDTKIQGYCYAGSNLYTEWREGYKLYNDSEPRDTCVAVPSDARRFCEMPWTRSSVNGNPADDYDIEMNNRIEKSWETRWRPPFIYDADTGRCHITRSYCKNSPVQHGGMGMGYGSLQDYFLWSDCKTHDLADEQVFDNFDCCTTFWASLFEFFFGRTLLADVSALVDGELSPAQFAVRSNPNYAIMQFVSDSRLKVDQRVLQENMFAPGINLVEFEWSPLAKSMYGKKNGRYTGVLAQNVMQVYPEMVTENEDGYLTIKLDAKKLTEDPVYRGIMFAAKTMNDVSTEP